MRRPRIKPEHRAYRTVEGNVRIGSVVHGIGSEVADPQGWVWTLVEAMDGTRDRGEIVADVLRAHPGADLGEADLLAAVDDLTQAGFVEDAGAPEPVALSAAERERYGRGMTLQRWMDLTPRASPWDPQLALRASRVLLVGVGGTGGAAARDLVASGVGHLHCVEPDTVELSNLNRQTLFAEADIGRPKLDAALRTLRALNGDVALSGERREVRGPDDLAELLAAAPYDALLLAADRPPVVRRWANEVCLATGTPWAEAGYRGPLVSVALFRPGTGACWVCLRDTEVERRELSLPPGEDEEIASPRMDWNPVNAVTAQLSGSLLAHAGLALLSGVPHIEPGCRFGFNLMRPGDNVLARAPRRSGCPACGKTAGEDTGKTTEGAATAGAGAGATGGEPGR
ncbi:HesA/MoeB/ThiF family protein [Streptomyces sp. P6-2-1]|uniref:HesA/MoeB/ThiF family protein n=1 Tax=Streptomyces sp. P6-2-1 TaxID=3422591 RepID=UPI003D36EAAA